MREVPGDIDWAFAVQQISYAIASGISAAMPTELERRRYALLQAAAIVMARSLAVNVDADTLIAGSVDGAEMLLAEIEKREKGAQ